MTRWTIPLILVLLAGPALARDAIEVTVDAARPGARIDRHVFGQFAEDLGTGVYGGIWVGRGSEIPNTRGIRNDVVAALKELHVPDVRWPDALPTNTTGRTASARRISAVEFGDKEYAFTGHPVHHQGRYALRHRTGRAARASGHHFTRPQRRP